MKNKNTTLQRDVSGFAPLAKSMEPLAHRNETMGEVRDGCLKL